MNRNLTVPIFASVNKKRKKMSSTNYKSKENKPKAVIEKIKIKYNGKEVSARKLSVTSRIPMGIETAWEHVKKPALLKFVAKGKIKFIPTNGRFPATWKEGMKVSARMLLYGFIPFGGLHYLEVEKIDAKYKTIQTNEWDNAAKVWKHRIEMKPVNNNETDYLDEIIIYGGYLTNFITFWAKHFYIHRQKRWQLVKNVFVGS
jgi:hypothetical protein